MLSNPLTFPKKQRSKGFTLTELLVVISIIGILAAIIIAAVSQVRIRARDVKRLGDMRSIQTALALYYDSYSKYPGPTYSATYSIDGQEDSCGGWDRSWEDKNGNGLFFLDPLVEQGFLSSSPVDPVNDAVCAGSGGNFHHYLYYRYNAGSNGCDISKGDFYVLAMNMEASGNPYPSSPGFSCNIDFDTCGGDPLCKVCISGGVYGTDCFNWQTAFDWEAGGFER